MTERPARQEGARRHPGEREDSWRRVPRVDLLPRRRREVPRALLARLAFLALLLAGGYQVYLLAQEVEEQRARLAVVEERLGERRRLLAQEEEALQELQGKVEEVKARREAAEALYRRAVAGRRDWASPLRALLDMEVPGARFLSFRLGDGDVLVFEGRAEGLAPMVTLQSLLLEMKGAGELVDLAWQEVNPPPEEGGENPPPYIQFSGSVRVPGEGAR